MKCVILAGGSGTRFWPYSIYNNPEINVEYKTEGEVTRMLAYSINNIPFKNNEANFIFSNTKINIEMLDVVVGSVSGHELE